MNKHLIWMTIWFVGAIGMLTACVLCLIAGQWIWAFMAGGLVWTSMILSLDEAKIANQLMDEEEKN